MNPELGGEVKNTFCSLWHGPVEWLRYGDVHPWLMWRMRFTHGKTPWASRKVPLRCGCLQIALDGSCLSNWTSSIITSATCKKHATETVYILLMLQDSHSIDNVCSYQAFVVTIDSHWSVSLLADLRRPQKKTFPKKMKNILLKSCPRLKWLKYLDVRHWHT